MQGRGLEGRKEGKPGDERRGTEERGCFKDTGEKMRGQERRFGKES